MISMSPPLELHASYIEELLEKKEKVKVTFCNKSLTSCNGNPFKSSSICDFCISRVNLLKKEFENRCEFEEIKFSNPKSKLSSELHEQAKIAVMSGLASNLKISSFDQLNTRWKKVFKEQFDSYINLYDYFLRSKCKSIAMFNGRFFEAHATRSAFNSLGKDFTVYDVKKSLHPIVFNNISLHNLEVNAQKALSLDRMIVEKESKKFFENKIKNKSTGDPIYTKHQNTNYRKSNNKKILSVFPTTDDEYRFIGPEWDGLIIESQVDFIKEIAKILPETWQIVVKMHPNQAEMSKQQLKEYQNLKSSGVKVIGPSSKINSYDLLFKSESILVFASTIGVESIYWGIPTIVAGTASYSGLDIGWRIKEPAEIIKYLGEKNSDIHYWNSKVWAAYLACYRDGLENFGKSENGYLYKNKRFKIDRVKRIKMLPSKLRIEFSKPNFKFFNRDFFERAKMVVSNIFLNRWNVR